MYAQFKEVIQQITMSFRKQNIASSLGYGLPFLSPILLFLRDSIILTLALIYFQTIYGELISLEDNSDVTGLAMFILNRLLWNPDIAAEYRHPTVPHLYRDGKYLCLSYILSTLYINGLLSFFLFLFTFSFLK